MIGEGIRIAFGLCIGWVLGGMVVMVVLLLLVCLGYGIVALLNKRKYS